METMEKTNKKYLGIEFTGASAKGKRLGMAYGKKAGINGEQNDFDSMPIYNEIKPMFNEMGEKAIYIPEFYLLHEVSDDGEAYLISKENNGDDWELVKPFLIGAYKATFKEEEKNLFTLSGAAPRTMMSLKEATSLVEKRSGVEITPLRHRGIIAILMMIEFGTRDLQSVFKGLTEIWYEQAKEIKTGECDQCEGSSSIASKKVGGCSSFSWRGIENLYGHWWEAVGDTFITKEKISFLNQEGERVEIDNNNLCGYPTKMRKLKGMPGILLADEVSDDCEGYSDWQDNEHYLDDPNDKLVFLAGGNYSYGDNDGPFCFFCVAGWTNSAWYFGFRLSYQLERFKEKHLFEDTTSIYDVNSLPPDPYPQLFECIDNKEQKGTKEESTKRRIHNLKIKAEYIDQVVKENKTFELRKNDRDYQVGDLIHFVDVDGNEFRQELNVPRLFGISYVLKGCPQYGLAEDYCIISIKKLVM